jgi:peptide/nickel transport system ATP-binding protein
VSDTNKRNGQAGFAAFESGWFQALTTVVNPQRCADEEARQHKGRTVRTRGEARRGMIQELEPLAGGGDPGRVGEVVLRVSGLAAGFDTDEGLLTAVDGVDFELRRGQTLGLVGESGCGKSVTARALMRLLEQPSGKILSGKVELNGRNLLDLPLSAMRKVRGREMAMIFQEPMTALNPVHRVGRQIMENLLLHHQMTRAEALRRAVELMEWVGIPAAAQRVSEHPHQLSGGMRQRVMIAMALSCNPDVLIADEPTTALDVTVQAQILDLIKRLQGETGMAVILITHDLGVVAETCDEVAVMYAGRIVERGPMERIFRRPLHPYTQGLMRCLPGPDAAPKSRLKIIPGMVPGLAGLPVGCRFAARCPRPHGEEVLSRRQPWRECGGGHGVEACACFAADLDAGAVRAEIISGESDREGEDDAGGGVVAPVAGGALLEVSDLKMHFPVRGGVFRTTKAVCRAVDGVSFSLQPGETLGLVGESGCGKSTVARSVVRLLKPTAGRVVFEGSDITRSGASELRLRRRQMQMVFQDPAESLNARHTVGQILEEPFVIQRIGTSGERRDRAAALLERVGLPTRALERYPFEFSGGQRQRIGIARALALNPRLIVCDEPVSALDVSVQAQVLNLLLELQRDLGLAYLFIAHDLGVVRHMSDRVAVMYLGRIVEIAPADELYRDPRHAYTKALLEAIPQTDPCARRERRLLKGDVPSPINPPEGCAFGFRMGHPLWEESKRTDLALMEVAPAHWVMPCPCCT